VYPGLGHAGEKTHKIDDKLSRGMIDDGQIGINALGFLFTKLDIDLLLNRIVHVVAPKIASNYSSEIFAKKFPTDRLRPTDKACIVFHPLVFIYPLDARRASVFNLLEKLS
jgi:hypothetical protein